MGNRHGTLHIVFVFACLVGCIALVGIVNHVRWLLAADVGSDGLWLALRRIALLAVEGVTALIAAWSILRRQYLTAYNMSAVFVGIPLLGALSRLVAIMAIPPWQIGITFLWMIWLAWLLWRILPNTSLKRVLPP